MGAILALALGCSQASQAAVQRLTFQSGNNYLVVEVLSDNLVHFEVSGAGSAPGSIPVTPQVSKTDFGGPATFKQSGNTLETAGMQIAVNATNLCMTLTDAPKNLVLTTVCPQNLSQATKRLTVSAGGMQHVYGLGEQFIQPGQPNGDWTASGHQQRNSPDPYGNAMVGFDGGATGNVQIPVLYAVGPGHANYALFLDDVYKQTWDFSQNPWKAEMWGDQIRGYLITGQNLPALRKTYMELTGRPPVPPKKMFGLWVSEYGYDNWAEIDNKLSSLRKNQFPIDGFVLDLQWFGGVAHMGGLTFDPGPFPKPAGKLASYRNQGIGLMAIEESYINQNLPEYTDLKNRGFLIKKCQNGGNGSCDAAAACPNCPSLTFNVDWIGNVGMVDWTNDAAADYWHNLKRQPLISLGLTGHWTDLGEPERYDSSDWAFGILPAKHAHADYHNLYNLKWAQSIARGYARTGATSRPFILTRSGAAGIQRFGAGVWSGDSGSRLSTLASHFNAQMHMSFSGIDYFSADTAGFHRQGMSPEELNDMYTRWYAYGMMFDIPGRPHTENLNHNNQTAPDCIGDLASNLANTRQRYELSPYVYSLAYRAYLEGEPVAPPPVYYYQNDMNLRQTGDEKMMGADILVAAVSAPGPPNSAGETQRNVYLPAGDWINYHTNQWFRSSGQTFAGQPEYRNGIFRLPTYVRAGALLPKMYVDEKTLNVVGKRSDGTTRNELIARVYASSAPSAFTLYEDDGQTIAYQGGTYRTTEMKQQFDAANTTETVVIQASTGTYPNAPGGRNNVIELVAENRQATAVVVNGTALAQLQSQTAFDGASAGWYNAGNNLILAKTGTVDVSTAKTVVFMLGSVTATTTATFACSHGDTTSGQSVYVVGNIAELGNWNPALAPKLNPDGPYPTWTGTIEVPAGTPIEWKCIKRPESAANPVQWEAGSNHSFASPAAGNINVSGDFQQGPASAQLVCDNGQTNWGQSVYAVGNLAALGNWDPGKAIKLEPTNYPRWTGTAANLPPNTVVEWKCLKRPEGANGPVDWQPDPNNRFTTPAAGQTTAAYGNFQ